MPSTSQHCRLASGTTVLVTQASVSADSTGVQQTLMDAGDDKTAN